MKKTCAFLIFYSIISSVIGQSIQSPSKNIIVSFSLNSKGNPIYEINYKDKKVVNQSKLGLELKKFPNLKSNFNIIKVTKKNVDQIWKPVLGEESKIRNHFNQMTIFLVQKETNQKLNIIFRAYDEGVAFRYEFPLIKTIKYFIITNELTEFSLTGNHKTFWIPGDYDSQEYVYNETKLSEIDNSNLNLSNGIALKSIKNKYRVQAPLLMKTTDGLYINIFEAAVVNYPVMQLNVNPINFTIKSELVPNAIGDKAYLSTPSKTPWRTIMISDDARDIVGSKMILNLNDPCKLKDTSWIKPMKYVGIWWEMHIGKSTWAYAERQNALTNDLIPSGKHGATTANAKKYIDFAAKYGFDGVLIEGWNIGWENWFGNWKEDVFDFTTPYPDFDIKKVSNYAKSKGVKLIMHNETSGSVANYERHLDRALELMKKYGYTVVKTGYVGRIIPRGEFHYGQTMVNHYNYVVRRAADFKIMVNSHESSRPTGLSRTYPNYIAAEAARGNEFNAWSSGNPPCHETILPFTRLLGGPMDYTPGIFELKLNFYNQKKKEQVHTTLTKQLALYVTMYSPLQMAADLPENYEKHLDAFQFIRDVPVDWQKSIYIEAEPGDYLTVARKDKNSENWFIGAITDENARKSKIKLDFLTPYKKYRAIIYEDGKKANWKNNPKSYKIKEKIVSKNDFINLNIAPGGGTAISLKIIN